MAYTGKKIISLDEVQALNLIDAYVPATTLLDSESTIRSTVRVNIGKLGYEIKLYGKNISNNIISAGTVCYANSINSIVCLNIASNILYENNEFCFGVVESDINPDEYGILILKGVLSNIDTSTLNDNDLLWLSTDGTISTSKQNKKYIQLCIGFVIKSDSIGTIYVDNKFIPSIKMLGNINLDNITDGQSLVWDDELECLVPSDISFGPTGPTGRSGESITGPTGVSGQSITGPTGVSGQSITGPTGSSGQSITGPTGVSGQSITGPTGVSGQSITGPTGLKGATGASGLSITGPTGVKGATGASGLSITGPTGVSGQSITGPTGPTGMSPTNSVQYDAGSSYPVYYVRVVPYAPTGGIIAGSFYAIMST